MTITILFTCHKCGLQRVRVLVPARRNREDIGDWMRNVGQLAGARHSTIRPDCPQRQLDLAIPMPANDGDGIGMSAAPVPDNVKLPQMNSKGAN